MRIIVYPHELIGVRLRIEDSTSKDLVGLEGKVLDETQNLLVLDVAGKKEMKILKSAITLLSFQKGENVVELSGAELLARPWDRVKG